MAALITVVVPAFNAAATLAQTLASLAHQTERDFEVVLVDDASTDATAEIAAQFTSDLPLRVLRNDSNAGVSRSLNRGIAASDSDFIARLDADDLAQPERLARQLACLRAQPKLDAVGSHMGLFRSVDEGVRGVLAHPVADATIQTALVQRNALSHPSLLLRRSFFTDVGLYNPALDHAEDYDLWCRGALLGKHYANLPDVLTLYRVHAGSVSQSKMQQQYGRDLEVKRRYIGALLAGGPLGSDAGPALLPQLFAAGTRFADRQAAAMALAESSAALLALHARVRDPAEYAAIVKACLQRHLIEGPA